MTKRNNQMTGIIMEQKYTICHRNAITIVINEDIE